MSQMDEIGATEAGRTNKQLKASDIYVVRGLSVVDYKNVQMACIKSRCRCNRAFWNN